MGSGTSLGSHPAGTGGAHPAPPGAHPAGPVRMRPGQPCAGSSPLHRRSRGYAQSHPRLARADICGRRRSHCGALSPRSLRRKRPQGDRAEARREASVLCRHSRRLPAASSLDCRRYDLPPRRRLLAFRGRCRLRDSGCARPAQIRPGRRQSLEPRYRDRVAPRPRTRCSGDWPPRPAPGGSV